MQYVEVLIGGERADCRTSVFSRRWGRSLPVDLRHLPDGLRPHFAVCHFSLISNGVHFQDVLLPMPCDSGSKVLFANQDIEHLFRARSSFSTDWIFWLYSRAVPSGLFDPSANR